MNIQFLQSDEAKTFSDDVKSKAWKEFKRKYPFADLSKFEAQTDFIDQKHAVAEIYLKAGPGFRQSVSESDRRYWSDEMKEALGIGGFPVELILNDHTLLPVPAVQFEKNPESISKLFEKINIFVSPTEYFVTKFRDIFLKTQIKHTTGKESRSWLSGPKMKYWPQQLNFALWCATTGSGISREILNKLSQQLRGFFLFHVYFTVRRILFEMGGIQSFSALPGDPTFNQTENKFDSPSFKRICAEFGIDPNTDFRFVHGQNHGLGYCYVSGDPQPFKHWSYPPASLDNPSSQRFSDEKGSATQTGNKYLGNELDHIINEEGSDHQFDWFVPDKAEGLTQAGLSRINQSIEAFVYCVLGAQVNVRSSILGDGGRAKEAQTEFLVLLEESVRQPNLSKSVQRYQLAVDEAKVRLNLAVAPGTWLMPARMVLNTGSVAGYNNQLRQATPNMKLGVNNSVNLETKKVGVRLMDGEKSKIDRPTSHPSNPIHKAETSNPNPIHKANPIHPNPIHNDQKTFQPPQTKLQKNKSEENHEILKVGVFMGAAISAFAVYRMF